LNGLDPWLAYLWEGHPIKGVAFNDFATDEPMKEGTSRTSIGLDGPFDSRFTMLAGDGAHVGKPATDVGGLNLADQGDFTLLLQVGSHQSQGRLVPFERLDTMIATFMVLQVVFDRSGNRHSLGLRPKIALRPFSFRFLLGC